MPEGQEKGEPQEPKEDVQIEPVINPLTGERTFITRRRHPLTYNEHQQPGREDSDADTNFPKRTYDKGGIRKDKKPKGKPPHTKPHS